MRRTSSVLLVAPFLVLAPVLALAAAGPDAGAGADLSGTWTLVPKRSDDVREKLADALGALQGDLRPDTPQAWVRGWLIERAEHPAPPWVLTIEQTAAEFRAAVGDEVRIYYFGRAATRQGPGGGLRRATVRAEGPRVVVEERAEKGSGHLVEVYERQPDGRGLQVRCRLEHKSLRQPLELTLGFQRTTPQ